MGTFTLPLKKVIELTGGTTSVNSDGIRIMTGGNIGLGYYKPHVLEHKQVLDGLIIDHYFNREIGQETIQLFQLAMRRKLNEIMPYYNQFYKSELLAFDPMHTINIHTVGEKEQLQNVTVDSDAVSDSEHKSGSRTVQSQFPQTTLSPNADYATAAADANSTTDGSTTAVESKVSDSDTNETNDVQVTGYQAYPSNLLNQFRATFLNIDLQIIAELDELFMQIWNNGDEYTPPSFPNFGYYQYF